MKHLRPYVKFTDVHFKMFESIDTINDIKDILLELNDENFNVRVKESDHHVYSKCVNIVISKDGGNFDFWTERNIGELTPFTFGEVKEYLLRVLSYTKSERWHDFNFDIVTGEQLHQCLDSKSFNDGTYKTPVKIKDDEVVNSYYNFKTHMETDTPIEDDVNILCVYIGLGK
jgi:hypothetical protein